MISKTCVYGIRATLFVAAKKGNNFLPISHVAEELGISFHFLTKILQTLTQHRIMQSYRGPKGGIALAKPAEEIMISEIIEAIDGSQIFTECILGLPGCGELKPCPLHDHWSRIRGDISGMLQNASVANLARKVNDQGLRLSDVDPKT